MLTILILCIVLFFWFTQKPPYIPRKIWMFSDNPDTLNIQNSLDPRDDLVILTKKNYKGYVVIPEDISEHPVFTINSQRFCDLICLWVLAEHGGIWINTVHQEHDVSTVHQEHGGIWININSSLELTYNSDKEFNGYYTPHGIDTRYMECKKGTPFISAWRDEYSRMAQFPSVERYLESRSIGDIRYENMDPLMVACKLILPEHIKNIELRG
jgi:hypothetical protein